MNRWGFEVARIRTSVPHMRGDEPWQQGYEHARAWVFPTCVGMNRDLGSTIARYASVPHMRGDEPAMNQTGR